MTEEQREKGRVAQRKYDMNVRLNDPLKHATKMYKYWKGSLAG